METLERGLLALQTQIHQDIDDELKVETDKRIRFLNDRNQLDNQINNYIKAEKEYMDAGGA